jgi:hypothetical protein
MRNESRTLLPKARSKGLVIKKLADEVLVYDLERDKAHCLNHASARVWNYCDGRRSVKEIALSLESEAVEEPFTEEMVWLALGQLERFSLLEERVEIPAEAANISRRELGKRLGLVGAASLPFILSIVAPVAASAATCGVVGSPCTTNARCCSGICIGGVCACVDKDSPCATDAQCCSNRCGSALNKCLP